MAVKQKSTQSRSIDDSDRKFLAAIGVGIPLVGFLIDLIIRRDDKYIMFYAKQGLVLFILSAVLNILVNFIDRVIINFYLFNTVLWVLLFVIWILGIVNACSGEMKNTIIIGDIAKKFNV